jgi:SAM-dependent methyltransferase
VTTFANLPPIAGLTSEADLQERARLQFGLAEAVTEYRAGDAAPIPSTEDREGYYGTDHAGYWLSGLSDALAVRKQAEASGLEPNARYFEFGCGSGRVVRHLALHTDMPIACCDIKQRHTDWIRLFLPNRIEVFQNSMEPGLAIEDNSVDIATAFSVFTHIDDFEAGWLLELRRILRPGGLAYLTASTDHTWELYKHQWIKERLLPIAAQIPGFAIDEQFFEGPLPREKSVFAVTGDHNPYPFMTFHQASYIRREWGRILKFQEIIPNGHFYQDVVLLTK